MNISVCLLIYNYILQYLLRMLNLLKITNVPFNSQLDVFFYSTLGLYLVCPAFGIPITTGDISYTLGKPCVVAL